MTNGFNKLRWNCQRDGCFNLKRRPKIEVFAECFPRRINFGDVDGLVEINGRFCLIEWKGEGGMVREGQARSYIEFSKHPGNIVFCVDGNAETMEVTRYFTFWNGKRQAPTSADLDGLKARIKRWVQWVALARAA